MAQPTAPNSASVTADDCQIIAQILSTKTTNPLSFASFGAACDWARLGLHVRTTTATDGWRSFFRKPDYEPGGTKAMITYSDSYDGTKGMYGAHEFRCGLYKNFGQWRVISCAPGVIAN
jgi:hypothetical protein